MATRTTAAEALERFEELPMRVGMGQIRELTDERLQFVNQLGVEDVVLSPYDRHERYYDLTLTPREVWTVEELSRLRERVERASLRLFAVAVMPYDLYEILLDEEEADAKTEVVADTVRNMGEAGIPVLGYSALVPEGVGRTGVRLLRGGARAPAFDPATVEDRLHAALRYDEEELWERYERFLARVLPVAEESGVRLGLHPADPPVPAMDGYPVMMHDVAAHERAMDLVPSDNHGFKLGLGCFSEMGVDVPALIRRLGGEKIVYVHFRDVEGTVDAGFNETFVDDPAGNYDPHEALAALRDVGFSGVVTPDHVPELPGDVEWARDVGGYRGWAFTVGYLRATLRAVERERA